MSDCGRCGADSYGARLCSTCEARQEADALRVRAEDAEKDNARLREALDDLLATDEGAWDAPSVSEARSKARAALAATDSSEWLRALVTRAVEAVAGHIRTQAKYANSDGAYLDYVRGLWAAADYADGTPIEEVLRGA